MISLWALLDFVGLKVLIIITLCGSSLKRSSLKAISIIIEDFEARALQARASNPF